MNYAQKQEEKKDYYLGKAAAATRESEGIDKRLNDMAGVMNGHPILVGHHSEKRHRRDRDRLHNQTRKSIDLREKAEYYEGKAKNMGKSISSDDPEAVEKLKEKIEKAEKFQAKMKAGNKIIKSKIH